MGGSHVGCAEQIPNRMEPEIGQVPENEGQSASRNKGRHIFQPDDTRLYFAKNSDDVGPEPPVIVNTLPVASCAPWLAGKTGSDAIHAVTPASAIEGGNVVPDRRRMKDPFFYTRHQPRTSKGFPLHVHEGAVVGHGELEAEFEASKASAERESVDGTYSHMVHRRRSRFAILAKRCNDKRRPWSDACGEWPLAIIWIEWMIGRSA